MRSHKIMFYNMMIKNRLRAMDFSRTQLGRMCWVLINPRADQIESTFMYILYTILIKKNVVIFGGGRITGAGPNFMT